MTVKTYAELDNWTRAWSHGNITSLVLLGNGGLAKTTGVTRALRSVSQPYEYLKGGDITAAGLYRFLFLHAEGELLVLDDLDDLRKIKAASAYLKGCLDTNPNRVISRVNAKTVGDDGEIPTSFQFTSKVCIVMNEWDEKTTTDRAIVDRVVFIDFAPDAAEVHRRVGSWGAKSGKVDLEVYAWIGENLRMIPHDKISMRPYEVASQVKREGMDWRVALLRDWGLSDAHILIYILSTTTAGTEDEKCQAWCRQTGKGRATYFRWKKKMGLGGESPAPPAWNGGSALMTLGNGGES